MARSWEYSRRRRVAMQAVMCGILGLTVGAAGLVVHRAGTAGATPLSAARFVDGVGVRLPKKWLVDLDAAQHPEPGSGAGPTVLFAAREPDGPDDEGANRTLTVRRQRVGEGTSATAYLDAGGLLGGTQVRVNDPGDPDGDTPVTVAGTPGVLREVVRLVKPALGERPAPQTEWFAAAVLPSGVALSVQLVCPDEEDKRADRNLITRVAAEMRVQ